jgi:hypothetical protein
LTGPPLTPEANPSPTARPADAAKTTGTATVAPPRDEKYSKDRMRQLQAAVGRDLADQRAAEARVRRVAVYPAAACSRLQSTIETERLRAAADSSKLTAMTEHDRDATNELEDEARYWAGVPAAISGRGHAKGRRRAPSPARQIAYRLHRLNA